MIKPPTREQQVSEFHKAMGIGKGDTLKQRIDRRIKLMREELDEVEEALACVLLLENKTAWSNLLKELCDLQYVLSGTVDELGLKHKFTPAFNRVHQNNMEKLGPDGKPTFNEYGKLMKPEGYVKVNLEDMV